MDIEEAAKKFYEAVKSKQTLGDYILSFKKLGESGFGITYEAKHKNTQETVVIKTYDDKLDRDPNFAQFKEQFDKERQQIFDIRKGMFPIPNVGPPCLVEVKESFPPPADEKDGKDSKGDKDEKGKDAPPDKSDKSERSDKPEQSAPKDQAGDRGKDDKGDKGGNGKSGDGKEEKKDPQSFLAMHFVAGKSLADLVKEQGKLSEKDAVKYITQVGKELQKLHAKGFIHKDVNPKNIILQSFDTEMKAVLVDFGLARHIIPAQFPKGRDPGLKPYDPPEQVRGGAIVPSPAYDIYGLAATLYFAVTGVTPIPAASRCLYRTKLPSPREAVEGLNVSEALNRGVMKGMELSLLFRPNSMDKWLKMIKPKDIPFLLLFGLISTSAFLPHALRQNIQSTPFEAILTAIALIITIASLAVKSEKIAKKLDAKIMAFLYIMLGLGIGLKIATLFAISTVGLFAFWSQDILKKSFMPNESLTILIGVAFFGIILGAAS
jgi:serine/threonine protein kinase